MTEPYAPARLRHTGRVLRTLREEANLTQSRAGRLMGRSSAYLSLVEKGRSPLHIADLKHMLDVYGVPLEAPLRAGLLTLCQQQREGGWWDEYRGTVSPAGIDYASLEHHASALFVFETNAIPGLFQTLEYAQHVVPLFSPAEEQRRTERLVDYRMARQRALARGDAPRLRVVIDETVLRRSIGGNDLMRHQLVHLLEKTHEQRVILSVLPLDSDVHPGIGAPFTLLEIGAPRILGLVLIDHLTGRLDLDGQKELDLYLALAQRLEELSLPPESSRSLIEGVVSEL